MDNAVNDSALSALPPINQQGSVAMASYELIPNSVRDLYDTHPYPIADPSSEPIYDVGIALSFIVKDMSGLRVLDVGCGTGHRLVGMAVQFPETEFLGIDFSPSSVLIAEEVTQSYGAQNVSVMQRTIGGESLDEKFDVAVCTGVIHHLPDALEGVSWIRQQMNPDGLLYGWHYHPYGEFSRLLTRELIQTLSAQHPGSELEVINALGASLPLNNYGSSSSAARTHANQISADMDAYMNPVVNAYTLAEALAILGPFFDWSEVFSVNLPGRSLLLKELISPTRDRAGGNGVMSHPLLSGLFDELPLDKRMRCIELALRPTGFSTISGNEQSRRLLAEEALLQRRSTVIHRNPGLGG